MRTVAFTTSYIAGNSWFHRLHITVKLVVLFSYIAIIFASQTPLTFTVLYLIIIAALLAMRLPLRNRTLVLLAILLLVAAHFVPLQTTVAVRLIVGLGQVVCLMMVISVFSMTTKPNDILQLVKQSSQNASVFLME